MTYVDNDDRDLRSPRPRRDDVLSVELGGADDVILADVKAGGPLIST